MPAVGHGDEVPTSAQRAHEAMAFAGGANVSWSVVLEARLARVPSAAQIRDRLWTTLPVRHPELAVPLPDPIAVDGTRLDAVRAALAERPYAADEPAIRVAVVHAEQPVLMLAAHHGALDGLGLVGLLGLVLGEPVRSSVRGLAERRPRRSFARAVLGRTAEALFTPPARVAPAVQVPDKGDVLVAHRLERPIPSAAALLTAATRAVRGWNADRGGEPERLVVAIGASRRDGDEPSLERRAAYLRLRLDAIPDDGFRALLRRAAPEPIVERPGRLAPVAALGRPLARRLGSTLLLSSLGDVSGPAGLEGLAFFPVAHGRSGVSLGAAGHGPASTLTFRARRSDFDPAAAQQLLGSWAWHLQRPERRPAGRIASAPSSGVEE